MRVPVQLNRCQQISDLIFHSSSLWFFYPLTFCHLASLSLPLSPSTHLHSLFLSFFMKLGVTVRCQTNPTFGTTSDTPVAGFCNL